MNLIGNTTSTVRLLFCGSLGVLALASGLLAGGHAFAQSSRSGVAMTSSTVDRRLCTRIPVRMDDGQRLYRWTCPERTFNPGDRSQRTGSAPAAGRGSVASADSGRSNTSGNPGKGTSGKGKDSSTKGGGGKSGGGNDGGGNDGGGRDSGRDRDRDSGGRTSGGGGKSNDAGPK